MSSRTRSGKSIKISSLAHPARKVLQHVVNGDACRLDARLSAPYFRVQGDSLLPDRSLIVLVSHGERCSRCCCVRLVVRGQDDAVGVFVCIFGKPHRRDRKLLLRQIEMTSETGCFFQNGEIPDLERFTEDNVNR
jgi:hypothetical protein